MAIIKHISEVYESPLLLKLKAKDKKRDEKFIALYYKKLNTTNKKSLGSTRLSKNINT